MLLVMHTDDFYNTWAPCYFISTRISLREREVLTCMWLLTSSHVSPISLISGLESCDLWPLGCLTAPVPQADVSPRCHVSSTPLFTVTVVSGCLTPQSPWLLPREGVREVGEATCHCPTAMEASGGPGAQHDCWKYNIWCSQRPFQ